MSQLFRHLIVIIALIPSSLCFTQESVNKTPSSSSAQNPETEVQWSDSVLVQNLPADGGFRRLLSTIRKVKLSPEANSWAVQIISGGGFAGEGDGNLTITSQGHLVWNGKRFPNAKENRCNVKLRDDVMQMLTQTVFSANASGWGGPTASFCADCFIYVIALQRREHDGIERTYVAYWNESTDKNISDEVRKVYNTFMTHKECKQ